jgi:hypothetical protein
MTSQTSMHQDAHHHIRELETLLSEIVSGEEARNPSASRSSEPAPRKSDRTFGPAPFQRIRRGYGATRTFDAVEQQPAAERSARGPDDLPIHTFEQKATALLDSYAAATRAAEDVLRRAEARLESFDRGTARLISVATDEIRRAVTAVHGTPGSEPTTPQDDGLASVTDPTLPMAAPRARGTSALVVLTVSLAVYAAYLHYRTSEAEAKAASAGQAAAETRQLVEKQTTAALERTERATREALTSAAEAKRMVAIMAAPDARRLSVFGKGAAPAASGQAMWSRSRGALVTASDLPQPAAGGVYQVWIDTSEGPLSLGFAVPDAQGRLSVTFDIPPQLPGSILGLLITREPPGGSTAPQGPVVLSN